MADDLIARAEASWHPIIGYPSGLVAELVDALKAERERSEHLRHALNCRESWTFGGMYTGGSDV